MTCATRCNRHREAVIKHLRACPPCQELYEQYEGIAYCLTCLPPPEPPATLVPKIIEHIRSAVKATVPDSVAKIARRWEVLYVRGVPRDRDHLRRARSAAKATKPRSSASRRGSAAASFRNLRVCKHNSKQPYDVRGSFR
jgi:hypothetical protein